MGNDGIKIGGQDKWKFSFFPIWRYGVFFCVFIVLIIFIGGVWQTVQYTKESVRLSVQSAQAQVAYRVGESIKVMKMLAGREEYSNPELPIAEKIKSLEKVNAQMGYMMVRYVDADMNVFSMRGSTSLASRDYMQRLFSTGKPQVTDSFLAGTDGVTLNYTIAVPLVYENEISGSIFCAIYFDEIQEVIRQSRSNDGIDTMLIGANQQVMSASNAVEYGNSYFEFIRGSNLLGTTSDKIEANILGKIPDSYWSFRDGSLFYVQYLPIENTRWALLVRGNFGQVYLMTLPIIVLLIVLSISICGGLLWLINRYVKKQMCVMDLLVQSLQELERKIYQDDRPADVELQDIIQLTSTGLSDGLTGVVTRTVFLNQLKSQLDRFSAGTLTALCFVDLDDLKKLNDTYGHKTGDVALKSIGYVLREYEKKYNGLVGRYGGDEFVLLLTGIDEENELKEVLDEISIRLHCSVGTENEAISMHCSIGVSIRKAEDSIERWIEKADEALYFVKQNGKGYYKIYQD